MGKFVIFNKFLVNRKIVLVPTTRLIGQSIVGVNLERAELAKQLRVSFSVKSDVQSVHSSKNDFQRA